MIQDNWKECYLDGEILGGQKNVYFAHFSGSTL